YLNDAGRPVIAAAKRFASSALQSAEDELPLMADSIDRAASNSPVVIEAKVSTKNLSEGSPGLGPPAPASRTGHNRSCLTASKYSRPLVATGGVFCRRTVPLMNCRPSHGRIQNTLSKSRYSVGGVSTAANVPVR